MKKVCMITLLVIQFGQIPILGQQTLKNEMNKPQRICIVRMTTMDNAKNSYLLHRFSNDSLLAFTFAETESGYQLNGHVVFKAKNIRRVYVKAKREIILANENSLTDTTGMQMQDSYAGQVNRLNFEQELGDAAFDLALFDPGTALISLGIGLLFGSNGITYYIRGNEKKFIGMVKQLTNKN